MRGLRDFGIFLRAENDLGHAFTVPQINENHAVMVPVRIDPAAKRDGLPDVGFAKLVAEVWVRYMGISDFRFKI